MKLKKYIYKTLFASFLYIASFFVGDSFGVVLIVLGIVIALHELLLSLTAKLRKSKMLNEEMLMLAIVLFMFLTDNYLEALALLLIHSYLHILTIHMRNKFRTIIFNNINTDIKYANLVIDNEVRLVDALSIRPDDLIVVYKDEMIPCDGVIIKGSTKLNTFDLTGDKELLPVKTGDDVYNETINTANMITIKVKNSLKRSASNKISKSLNAIYSDSKFNKKINSFSNALFNIMAISLITLFVIGFIYTKDLEYFAFLAIAFLIVLLPSPMTETVKYAYFASCSKLIKRGVLLKRSNTLDEILEMDAILFDKSSCLTKGEPKIVETYSDSLEKDELLSLIASCEAQNSYELLNPIKEMYPNNEGKISNYKEFENGISVTFDGANYLLGNLALMEKYKVKVKLAKKIGSVIYIAKDKEFLGYVVLRDALKGGIEETISNLAHLGFKDLIVLSSDNFDYVEELCQDLKINRFMPDASFDDKLSYIKKAQKEGLKLMVIGNGDKDAKLLKAANIGVATGNMGAFLDLKNSDMIILNNNLDHIHLTIETANKLKKEISFNLSLAILLKTILLLMIATGIFDIGIAIFTNTSIYLISMLNYLNIIKEKN